MASTATRWNLVVSTDTDINLRQFLANEGGGRKGDLSKFVEEAVRARIFQLTVAQIKAANAKIPAGELEAAIDEAVREVRAERRKKKKPTARRS
jgi:NAD-specific glutamate dehydrogenase